MMNSINKDGFSLTIRPMTEEEKLYAYMQPERIFESTGCIGFLRADLDRGGTGFYSNWQDIRFYWKTDAFIEEFDKVIDSLRFSEEFEGLLKNRIEMGRYCKEHKNALLPNGKEYGFRADTNLYSYMIRLNPSCMDFNFSCFCYNSAWFDNHLEKSRSGVRFVDEYYNTLFTVKDGGHVLFKYADGFKKDELIRYVDDVNFICGVNIPISYHIREHALKRKDIKMEVEPIDDFKINIKQKGIEKEL